MTAKIPFTTSSNSTFVRSRDRNQRPHAVQYPVTGTYPSADIGNVLRTNMALRSWRNGRRSSLQYQAWI